MKAVGAVVAMLLAISLAGCGGGSSTTAEGPPPSKAAIESCLRKSHASVTQGHQPGELAAVSQDEGVIVVILFPDGSKGEAAANELEDEPGVEGTDRQVETLHGGRVVVSLSHSPSDADRELSRRCVS